MNNILKWLVISSADPDNASMTIKGILLQHVGIFLAVLAILHVPFSQDTAYKIITEGCGYLGAALSIFGLARKLYYEFKK